jgi:hypothetical protein
MVTLREFPNKVFKDWNEAHSALKENEKRLISLKCAEVYKSIDKLGGFSVTPFLDKTIAASKGYSPDWMKAGNIYPVINTTLYMDSHKDVHFNGIWNRSLNANAGKLYYVEAHSLKVADIIAWPEDVKAFVEMVPWSFLGKSYGGETQALIYEIPDTAIKHAGAREVIDNKREMQNSVRMQYVKMSLALNSDSREWKENKELYDARIDIIANREVAEESKYFWAVDEAKIFKEGSMVIAGSNDVTPITYGDPAKGTPPDDTDPPEGIRMTKEQKDENAFYNNLI